MRGTSEKMYFHTPIVAPYRLHQFRYIAKVFPNHTICLYGRVNKNNETVWVDDLWRNEPFHCERFAEQDDATAGMGRGFFSSKLFWLLLRQKWGTVHVIGSGVCKLNRLMFVISALLGHSKLVSWSDGIPRCRMNNQQLNWKARFFRKHCVSAVFASGEWAMKDVELSGMKRENIINQYFSCDDEKYEEFREKHYAESRRQVRAELALNDDNVCVLTIARYIACKRLIDLAQAFLKIEERNPVLAAKLTWVLIGDGECRDHLPFVDQMRFVKVRMLKPMVADAVMKYYCASDIFAFPSEGDVWGVVVNEALSMGVPVICTDEIGASCLVKDDVNGYRIPIRAPLDMAEKLELLANDSGLRTRLGEGAVLSMRNWKSSIGIDGLAHWIESLNR